MSGLLDRRLLLVTGKGGVGKSTVAASLALRLASGRSADPPLRGERRRAAGPDAGPPRGGRGRDAGRAEPVDGGPPAGRLDARVRPVEDSPRARVPGRLREPDGALLPPLHPRAGRDGDAGQGDVAPAPVAGRARRLRPHRGGPAGHRARADPARGPPQPGLHPPLGTDGHRGRLDVRPAHRPGDDLRGPGQPPRGAAGQRDARARPDAPHPPSSQGGRGGPQPVGAVALRGRQTRRRSPDAPAWPRWCRPTRKTRSAPRSRWSDCASSTRRWCSCRGWWCPSSDGASSCRWATRWRRGSGERSLARGGAPHAPGAGVRGRRRRREDHPRRGGGDARRGARAERAGLHHRPGAEAGQRAGADLARQRAHRGPPRGARRGRHPAPGAAAGDDAGPQGQLGRAHPAAGPARHSASGS